MSSSQQNIYAIDYGTSNSLLSLVTENAVTPPLPLDKCASDPTIFRSLLYFPHQDACFYGQEAIDKYNLNSGEGRFIRSIKKYLPSRSFIGSYIDDRVVRLEDLIGYFLLEMRKRANEVVQKDVDKVIFGRPARYSMDPEEDRMAEFRMEKAAKIAGFKEIYLLPEPLAAAFDLRSRLKESKIVLVVDLGGGTSDFTLIKIGSEEYKERDLLSMGGVSIAGDLIDGAIMENEIADFFGSNVQYRVPLGRAIQKMPPALRSSLSSAADIVQLQKKDIYQFFKQVKNWALKEEDKQKLSRLEVLVEDQLGFAIFEKIDACKRMISEQDQVSFQFDYPDIEIAKTLSASRFREYTESLVQKIMSCLSETLSAASVKPKDVDIVYCTGGTSKLAVIQDELSLIFGSDKLHKSDHFHSVSKGLALRAQKIFF